VHLGFKVELDADHESGVLEFAVVVDGAFEEVAHGRISSSREPRHWKAMMRSSQGTVPVDPIPVTEWASRPVQSSRRRGLDRRRHDESLGC